MIEFEGFKKVTKEQYFKENIVEPRLIPFTIKKNQSRWTVKNNETGKNYFLKISRANATENMTEFLKSINAYKTIEKEVDHMGMVKDIFISNTYDIFVPEDKEDVIRSTWHYVPEQTTIHDIVEQLEKLNEQELRLLKLKLEIINRK